MAEMAEIAIYTTPFCPFCMRAVALLKAKGVPFTEINVAGKPELRREMEARSGGVTVPQIFIDGEPVGGSDQLASLEASGQLDRRLGLDHG